MLAVTRKINDRIHINDEIVIHVLDIKSKSVKIGVEAPANFLIFRGELYEKILESNKDMVAADFTSDDVKAFLGANGKKEKKDKA